jgi:uncharacterized membrane protein YfcA
MPHVAAFQFFGLIILGFVVGSFGTLIGAGGGFVLMPLLLVLYPEERPETLAAISLAVVFFNTLSGSAAYARMKRIDYKSGLMFAAATIPGAILGAVSTSFVSRRLFDGIFSVFLVVVGIAMILKPKCEEGNAGPHIKSAHAIVCKMICADGLSFEYSYNPMIGIVLSVFVGFLSSFLGIGGGIIHVPAMAYLLGFPVHIATATSHFVLAIMTFTGSMVHVAQGSFHHWALRTAALAIGVLSGAQLGAHFSNKVKGALITNSLATALVLVGIRILFEAF